MPLGIKGLTYFNILAKKSRCLENLTSTHFKHARVVLLFFEKGMSPDIISLPSNCSPVYVLWYRHTKLMTSGPYKNLWAKIYVKNVKISEILGQKFL